MQTKSKLQTSQTYFRVKKIDKNLKDKNATNNSKKVVEKLFCNKKELTKGSLF